MTDNESNTSTNYSPVFHRNITTPKYVGTPYGGSQYSSDMASNFSFTLESPEKKIESPQTKPLKPASKDQKSTPARRSLNKKYPVGTIILYILLFGIMVIIFYFMISGIVEASRYVLKKFKK